MPKSTAACRVMRPILAMLLIVAAGPPAAAQDPAAQSRQFGADYDGLNESQRAFVDGLSRRAGAILGQTLDPRDACDQTALSLRTTFDLEDRLLPGCAGPACGRRVDARHPTGGRAGGH